ncbi:MAG: HNH endonuclease [Geminicoccaceae bacterium]
MTGSDPKHFLRALNGRYRQALAGGDGQLGPCPLCGRPMIDGPSVDRHHLVPKSRGGREVSIMHRICHRQIHALFSHDDLARGLANPAALRADPRLQPFLRWIARKPPTFWQPTRSGRR